jgi:signal transduction histidine kinase
MAPEDQEKLMFQLRNRTQQTLSLVDNLLLWSRNQSESVKYIPSALPISGVMKFISDYTQLLQSEKQVSVTINSPSDGNVFADKDLLDCILRNIISNAYKFTPRGGAVNISISKSSNQWNFSIKDSGQGMTPAALQKLSSGISFTTIGTANEKGHGLGLQLVKDFLQLHNSRLKISSEIGVGSEFSFTLPAAD